jgi:hypothetical protein
VLSDFFFLRSITKLRYLLDTQSGDLLESILIIKN